MATGIRKRHSRGCRSRDGGACNCEPSFEAWVWSKRAGPDGKGGKLSKTFPTYAAAKGWREDAAPAVRKGKLRRSTRKTVRQSAEELLAGMRDGSIRSKRKRPYKPATIRSYERALGLLPEQREKAPQRLLAALGDVPLSELDRHVVQEYVERQLSAGWDPSTVHNLLDPLRVIYRRARKRDEVAIDPLEDLELPDPEGKRERIAEPAEAAALLNAVPGDDRALWATAFYAGLRRGELRALRVLDADLKAGVIRVRRGWDDVEGEQDGKTDYAARDVPIVGALRGELQRHLMRTGRRGTDLVFGNTALEPFEPSTVRRRADEAWEQAKLERITLHEGRHTFASLLIAAGVDLKQVSEYMGHGSIVITANRYAHLLPDARERAVARVDAFLTAAEAPARLQEV